MQLACTREILELHAFFAAWMTGRLARGAEAFARADGVIADGFRFIGPDGRLVERADLLQAIEQSHGVHAGPDAGFAIEVRKPMLRVQAEGLCVMTYEEWQTLSGAGTGRLSTAVFSPERTAPNGVVWRHVHETWLPDG